MSDSDGASSGQPIAGWATPQRGAPPSERDLIASLRGSDEATFMRLVEQYQAAMVRLAQAYVGD